MKNLIIAVLATAQTMDWWYIYCRSAEDAMWCTLTLFLFFMGLLCWLDEQARKRKRIRNTRRKIEKVTNMYNLRNAYGQSANE